jgi:hypothetical protein
VGQFFLRAVLQRPAAYAGMIFASGFGLVTFVLNRKKLMGAIGISAALLALWGGGASMQVGPRYN